MNLLIVDDEFIVIDGILNGVFWEILGFDKVLTAKSYEQALSVFDEHAIDILLSDIEMTDKSGLDLIEWTNKHYPETECIILSCHDEFHYARKAVSLKCLDYVVKPIPYDQLTQVLKRAMDVVRKEHKQSLLANYGKVYMKEMSESVTEDAPEDVVETATTYIRKHIAEDIKVEMLAKMTYTSPDHLTRLFKKKFNQTVTDYIIHQRMILAGELLKSKKMSVTMVSAEVGYSNYSYFIRRFRKQYGMSPREYQQNYVDVKKNEEKE